MLTKKNLITLSTLRKRFLTPVKTMLKGFLIPIKTCNKNLRRLCMHRRLSTKQDATCNLLWRQMSRPWKNSGAYLGFEPKIFRKLVGHSYHWSTIVHSCWVDHTLEIPVLKVANYVIEASISTIILVRVKSAKMLIIYINGKRFGAQAFIRARFYMQITTLWSYTIFIGLHRHN